jgi:hypothetical protein
MSPKGSAPIWFVSDISFELCMNISAVHDSEIHIPKIIYSESKVALFVEFRQVKNNKSSLKKKYKTWRW